MKFSALDFSFFTSSTKGFHQFETVFVCLFWFSHWLYWSLPLFFVRNFEVRSNPFDFLTDQKFLIFYQFSSFHPFNAYFVILFKIYDILISHSNYLYSYFFLEFLSSNFLSSAVDPQSSPIITPIYWDSLDVSLTTALFDPTKSKPSPQA